MEDFEKIKSLYEDIITSLLKGKASKTLEEFEALTEAEKKNILFNITDQDKIEERSRLRAKINEQKALEKIKGRIKQKPKIKSIHWLYATAASIVILLGITFLVNKNDGLQINTAIIAENNIEIGTDKAILILEDGSEVRLEKGKVYQSNNITSNGEEIIYLPDEQAGHTKARKKEIAYNTLTVPRGAQFQMTLSDGTKIWLNSESQLKYPIVFNRLETRKVDLVYGEAYFDVSPSTAHKGKKFKVFNQSQEVEVLGTEFNIKAYKDETNIYTTLVEGKVAIHAAGIDQTLAPSQQSNLDLQNNTIKIITVGAYDEIAWKDGIFNFKRKSLKDIMMVLSRWYDMDVVFADKSLEDLAFIGAFKKNRSIEDILLVIKNTNFIKGYEIHDKTLTIK